MMTPQRSPQPSVLVVDDDDDILYMTSYVLRKLGYTVATANSGAQGLAMLKDQPFVPCLILLDLMMPGIDGATFRKMLFEIPEAANVPVIILSGDNELATKAAEMHVDGFEQKPISIERLESIVAKYCKAAL